MNLLPGHICESTEFGGMTACGRCGLLLDTKAERPPCKPKADPPIGLTAMIEAARKEARRICDGQHAAINAGFRTSPHMGELRKAAVMMATAKLLERVQRNAKVIELLKVP